MSPWNPQHYRYQGERNGVAPDVINNAIIIIERVQNIDPRIVPVFTLKHLSVATNTGYRFLRRVVSRTSHPYKVFTLKKRIPGRNKIRLICAATPELKVVHEWIVNNILRHTKPHPASFAYHPGCQPEFAARIHCGCRYLLKIDIEDFFHRVSEGRVYRIFKSLGYPDLLSFELARITTVAAQGQFHKEDPAKRWPKILAYQSQNEGFLPQGFSTSPMLANLAMLDLDERLSKMAEQFGLKYSRYADDLAFSGGENVTKANMLIFKRLVLKELSVSGFNPNHRKTMLRGPGSRRIVLGMLVDGLEPRLSKEFKDTLRLHLHYLRSPDFGPSKHAEAQKTSVSGIYHRVRGLIGWALRVETLYGIRCLLEFGRIVWPPIDLRSPRETIEETDFGGG